METNTRRLHPLLTAAAISLTVFSAVGVASLTGLIPHSLGSQKPESLPQEQVSLQAPAEVAKPAEPAVEQPAPQAAPKPVHKKPVARTSAPKPAASVAYNDYGTPPPPPHAQAPAQAVETPKPVAQPGNFATVQAVREVKDAGEGTALGPIAGGIAGAVLGNQIGKGHGSQKVITVLGAAGGAFAGHAIEKQARGTTHWEVDVRRDDGTNETVRSDVAPGYQPGQRVKLIDGKLQPA